MESGHEAIQLRFFIEDKCFPIIELNEYEDDQHQIKNMNNDYLDIQFSECVKMITSQSKVNIDEMMSMKTLLELKEECIQNQLTLEDIDKEAR